MNEGNEQKQLKWEYTNKKCTIEKCEKYKKKQKNGCKVYKRKKVYDWKNVPGIKLDE